MKKSQASMHEAEGYSVNLGVEEVKRQSGSAQLKLWTGFMQLKASAVLFSIEY